MSLKEEFLNSGFLTGSRAYGTAGAGSDTDIVFDIHEKHTIRKCLKESGIETIDSEYNGGIYFYENLEKVNLIFVHPDEHKGWVVATKAMTEILKISEMDKTTKCRLFEILRCSFNISSACLKDGVL